MAVKSWPRAKDLLQKGERSGKIRPVFAKFPVPVFAGSSNIGLMIAFQKPVQFRANALVTNSVLAACLFFSVLSGWCQKNPAPSAPPAKTDSLNQDSISGKVIETADAANYTYFRVDTGRKKLWVAAPQFAVKVGDTVAVGSSMPMPQYHSKTLKRDFDVVYFTGDVKLNGEAVGARSKSSELPKDHPPLAGGATKQASDFSGIKKAEGGKSVAEIFANRTGLKGQVVKVRGKVVKYNGEIMGKNWLHIQDGTGEAGSNDLTVTSTSEAKLGDTVLVTGIIALDRDFGGGYRYNLMIEDAKLKVE